MISTANSGRMEITAPTRNSPGGRQSLRLEPQVPIFPKRKTLAEPETTALAYFSSNDLLCRGGGASGF
jgi:hypothetical protein